MDSQQYNALLQLLQQILENQTVVKEKALEDLTIQLRESTSEIIYLKQLLASKEALIAAKDETIMLLRATYNRPN